MRWMRDLNKRFGGKIGENPWPKTHRKCVSRRCAWGRVLGAHFQQARARRCTPSARRPNRDNTRVVPRSGAWRPTCRGPMRSFTCVILLFSLIFLMEHELLALTLKFLIDKTLKLKRNRFSEIIGKWTFCE